MIHSTVADGIKIGTGLLDISPYLGRMTREEYWLFIRLMFLDTFKGEDPHHRDVWRKLGTGSVEAPELTAKIWDEKFKPKLDYALIDMKFRRRSKYTKLLKEAREWCYHHSAHRSKTVLLNEWMDYYKLLVIRQMPNSKGHYPFVPPLEKKYESSSRNPFFSDEL